jgi:hypothetical protein
MSLCYDIEKWTIISLSSVAISLTVGLVLMQVVHGQVTYGQESSCIYSKTDRLVIVIVDPVCENIDVVINSLLAEGYKAITSQESIDPNYRTWMYMVR